MDNHKELGMFGQLFNFASLYSLPRNKRELTALFHLSAY